MKFNRLKFKMLKSTAKHRKVSSDMTTFNSCATKEAKHDFIRLCKEATMKCADVVKGIFYSYFSDFVLKVNNTMNIL